MIDEARDTEKAEQLLNLLRIESKRTESATKNAIREIVNSGLSLNDQFSDGNSLLHLAVAHSLHDEVQQLINIGVNIHLRNGDNITPVDIALENGDQAILQLLNHRHELQKYLLAKYPIIMSKYSKHYGYLTSDVRSGKVVVNNVPWVGLKSDIVFEDYMDWSDKIKLQRVQVCNVAHVYLLMHGYYLCTYTRIHIKRIEPSIQQ